MGIALSFVACSDIEKQEIAPETIPEEQDSGIQKYFLGEEVTVYPNTDGTYSLQGTDTHLFEDQLTDTPVSIDPFTEPDSPTESKLGLGGSVRKWTDNTIVYVLDDNLSSSVLSELQVSMEEWSSKTNIRFKERTNESNYITIRSNGDACNCGVATLGMNGSRGYIELGTRTTAVVIIHEIGHTLGYIHEQNRSDRDSHVIVNYDNIQDGAESQFYVSNSSILATDQFDISSTMMYGSYTFSKNGQPTITDLNGNVLPNRRAALSELDIQGTNQVYPSASDDGDTDDNTDDDTDDNTDDGTDETTDPCEGVSEWVYGQIYTVGDQVTYRGYLFERDFTSWNRITECGVPTAPEDDICEGVETYNRYNSYSTGDQVIYRGNLYTLGSNGYWSYSGSCNS